VAYGIILPLISISITIHLDSFEQAEEAIYQQERSIFAKEDLIPAAANQHLN
jgi:hypothetical protein